MLGTKPLNEQINASQKGITASNFFFSTERMTARETSSVVSTNASGNRSPEANSSSTSGISVRTRPGQTTET